MGCLPRWKPVRMGISSAAQVIHATKVGMTKKKKKTPIKPSNLPAPSEAVASGPTTGAQSKEKGEDPTILRNSLPIGVTYQHLGHFREYFSIPSSLEMSLPSSNDQVYRPTVARGEVDGPLGRS
ncbi:hypothetical protein LIER_04544 [Lithospermum erythrorhizon]|uniref:Uncharacterized protein n=1 Tax=Lithospermum erythrorhizon TaxID=34254 RepID=A0AAV3NX40_LITER